MPSYTSGSFVQAWKNAVALAGFEFFGDGTPAGCAIASDKNHLRPRWESIEPTFPDLTETEQIFLAHMLTFYNSEPAAWPVKKFLSALPNASLGHASARLDPHRREALASLVTTYEGW